MKALLQADASRIPLADESVHCVVTSPPYHGARQYAGKQDAGDIPDFGLELLFDCGAWMPHYPRQGLKIARSGKVEKWWERPSEPQSVELCGECHVCRMTAVGRELWRVLRSDGVVMLNYGDAFYKEHFGFAAMTVAKALVADGWWSRQVLHWVKPNPMPESVNGRRWEREREEKGRVFDANKQLTSGAYKHGQNTISGGRDKVEWEYGPGYELRSGSWRQTSAVEYIFMLVKGMGYWADAEAVREANAINPHWNYGSEDYRRDASQDEYKIDGDNRNRKPYPKGWSGFAPAGPGGSGRNPRNYVLLPTHSYRGAHYATYPPALIAPLIRATCPRWCCPVCGQGWSPVVERTPDNTGYPNGPGGHKHRTNKDRNESVSPGNLSEVARYVSNVFGYRPTCEHEHTQEEAQPGIVFDPFVGSGTTVAVARELGRRGIGQDISYPYLDEQARYRAKVGEQKTETADLPLFAYSENGDGESG